MKGLARTRGGSLWLALYALALVCVLSFVFFEVLDVDGSDFQTTRSRLSIKLVEGPHEDFKRSAMAGTVKAPAPTPALDLAPSAPGACGVSPAWVTSRPAPTPVRIFPVLLPRSCLSDVAPAA